MKPSNIYIDTDVVVASQIKGEMNHEISKEFMRNVTDMAKHWWQDKKLGTKHVFWVAIITGLLSGIVSSYLYGYVVQPLISPPQKPNLVIVYTQMTDLSTPHQHFIHMYVFNNGTTVAQYLDLQIELTNSTTYFMGATKTYGVVSSVTGVNLNGSVTPVSVYLSAIQPGQWESIDIRVSNYSVQEGNTLVLSSPVKTYLTTFFSSNGHVSIFNYSQTGTTNNWTTT